MTLPKYILWTNGRGNAPLGSGQTYLRLLDLGAGPRLAACGSDGEMLPGGLLLKFIDEGFVIPLTGVSPRVNLPLTFRRTVVIRSRERFIIGVPRTFPPQQP